MVTVATDTGTVPFHDSDAAMTVMRRMTWTEMSESDRAALCARGLDDIFEPGLRASIGALIDDVRARGDVAVCDALAQFDHVELTPEQLQITADEIESATVDAALDDAIDDAIAHLRRFNEQQLAHTTDWRFESEPGLVVGEKLTPIATA